MLVEPITISAKSLTPPAQARLPAEKAITGNSNKSATVVKEPDSSRLIELLDDVQKDLKIIRNVDLRFSIHEASGIIMVTVIDGSTGEIIRELPSSEILDIAARVDKMISLIIDQKA